MARLLGRRHHGMSPGRILGLGLGWLVLAAGCAERVYRADRLPMELAATPPVSIDAINLSGLADPPVQTDQIAPGDVLEVTLLTDASKLATATAPVRVSEDGTVEIPLIGRVSVAGLGLEEAEQTIAAEARSRGIFRNPCVTVTMKQPRTNKITVVGAVQAPGVRELPSRSSTLLAALVAAGGLTKEAGPEVEIRHTKPPSDGIVHAAGWEDRGAAEGATGGRPWVERVNLATAAQDRRTPYWLQDGDVVHVFKRQVEPISVLGLVRQPGEFEFPTTRPLRVLDAIALAGGTSNPVADKVLILRRPLHQPNTVSIELSLQQAKKGAENLPLQAGDTVVVEQTAATAFVETLQTFFRVGFTSALPIF